MADMILGVENNRFQVDSIPAATTLISGTGLMALRSVLEGDIGPDYPEQVAKIILKALGLSDSEARSVSFTYPN